jgi:hypothetical protein
MGMKWSRRRILPSNDDIFKYVVECFPDTYGNRESVGSVWRPGL